MMSNAWPPYAVERTQSVLECPAWARSGHLDATREPSAPRPNEAFRRRRADNASVDRLAVILR
jgi:hypothetical protein